MYHHLLSFARSVVASAALLCGCTRNGAQVVPAPLPSATRLIHTRYVSDRFFGVAITATGENASFFLDTGDNSRIWDTFATRVRLTPELVRLSNNREQRQSPLPAFRADRAVPPPIIGGGRVIVTPPTDKFDTLMATHSDGQLGWNWFAGRVWTFDYPARRLLLHEGAAPPRPSDAHDAVIAFPTDSAGRRVGHVPRIVIVVDGDSINTLFDTGATIWMPDEAHRAIGDGQPAERASSLIWHWIFVRWRQRHPDWPVLDNADRASGAPMIRVPSVRIAGFDVGPVWFRSLTSATTEPPPPRAGTPAVRRAISGTVGGNILRNFVITVDYPSASATFTPAR